MLAVHEKIGLPLKSVWTGVNTNANIVHQIEKTEEGELRYKFLGTDWDLYNNQTSPLPYQTFQSKTSMNTSRWEKLEEHSVPRHTIDWEYFSIP